LREGCEGRFEIAIVSGTHKNELQAQRACRRLHSPVSADYKSPNAFAGKIDKVTFNLGPIAPETRGEIRKLKREVRLRKATSE
jgi:hypothetical protein